MGLLDQIFCQCSLGRAANAVRSGWASISIWAISGNGSFRESMTCWYWAATACLLVWAKMVETSALTGLERAGPSPGGDGAGEVDPAALPGGPGQDGSDGGADAGVGVTGRPARPRWDPPGRGP